MNALLRFQVDALWVELHASKADLGRAAAARAAMLILAPLERRGRARLIVGTGPSQNETVAALAGRPLGPPGLDWTRIELIHMDEYIGLGPTHPASFRRWLKERLADRVHPGTVHFLNGDAPGAEAECRRYGGLLREAPVDICFLGFGENGHIAFNDPHVADFHDPLWVKRVAMDQRCRLQQVGEGHFPSLDAVPPEALTLTCPALMAAEYLICSVPDRRKAEAVRRALEGPISTRCPASLVRTHAGAVLYLEPESGRP